MDDIDIAQLNDELFRRQALARHFAGKRDFEHDALKGQEPRHEGTAHTPSSRAIPIGRLCRDCGEPIDPARREVNPEAVRCLDCQTETERNRRHGAL
jgi:DnaK suppressor protein